MSITYEEALATLQSMFAEPWTRDTLDLVLRHQKGHMENTVDLILRHGNNDPEKLVEQLESGIDPRQSSAAGDEELARQLSLGRNVDTTSRSSKGKPTTLPEDFLRVPGVAPGGNNLDDDEALARMLQDELFTDELRRNPDLAHLARGRSNHQLPVQRSTSGQPNPAAAAASRLGEFASRLTGQQQPQPQGSNRNVNVPQSPNIIDKISELGDNAKRRLQLLAAQFNANKNNNNNSNRAAGTTQSPAATEFRSLLDDDDDNMELAARKDL